MPVSYGLADVARRWRSGRCSYTLASNNSNPSAMNLRPIDASGIRQFVVRRSRARFQSHANLGRVRGWPYRAPWTEVPQGPCDGADAKAAGSGLAGGIKLGSFKSPRGMCQFSG